MLKIKLSRYALRIFGVVLLLVSSASYADSQSDPPGRVARLSYVEGSTSFAPAGSNDWVYMQTNRPLIGGDRLWVANGARSELHLGSTALRLGSQTSLEFLKLTDNIVQVKVSQGELNLRVRRLAADDTFEVDTPNVAFVIQQPGSYRIHVDPNGDITGVAIWQGRGIAYGNNSSLVLDGNQQVRFTGTDLSQLDETTAPTRDSFDTWAYNRDRAEDRSISARYLSREIIGYEQLDAYGSWQQTSQYGPVWVPNVVEAGWAPYRTGHWSWISPWGWTWIDDAPWGFAPYHYGRWAYLSNTWCWVPGTTAVHTVPVYAPALVAFVVNGHGGGNVSWSFSVGSSTMPGIAWLPLGPGEIYRPGYTASPRYVTNVNKTVIVNTTVNQTTISNVTKTVYVNQTVPNAVTAVPIAAFTHGHPVALAAQPVKIQQVQGAQIIGHTAPIAPVRESALGTAKPATVPPIVLGTPVHGFMRPHRDEAKPMNTVAPRAFTPSTPKVVQAAPVPHNSAALSMAAGHAEQQRRTRQIAESEQHVHAVAPTAAPVVSAPQLHHDEARHAQHQMEEHGQHESRSEINPHSAPPLPRQVRHGDPDHQAAGVKTEGQRAM
jgi:hypothetical protein